MPETSRQAGPSQIRMAVESVSTWELLGAVSQFRHNVERYRWYVSSMSTIRFLSILNVTYSLIGLAFLMLAHFPPHELRFQQQQFLCLGVAISFVSPLALFADVLALHGLGAWRRAFVLPWLFVYGIILALAFGILILDVYNRLIRWHHLLLMLCAVIVFSRWRHISIQYRLMGLYSEKPSERAINELAGEIREAAASSTRGEAPKDTVPPPKYEDLEQPPQYDETTMHDAKMEEAVTASVLLMSEQEENLRRQIAGLETKIANSAGPCPELEAQLGALQCRLSKSSSE